MCFFLIPLFCSMCKKMSIHFTFTFPSKELSFAVSTTICSVSVYTAYSYVGNSQFVFFSTTQLPQKIRLYYLFGHFFNKYTSPIVLQLVNIQKKYVMILSIIAYFSVSVLSFTICLFIS